MAGLEQQRTVWTVITALVVIVLVVISVMAYQSVNTDNSVPINNDIAAVDYTPYQAVKVNFDLPNINTGHYALWGVDNQNKYFLVKQFKVDRQGFITNIDGQPINTIFTTDGQDLSGVASFVVTVEENSAEPVKPSITQVLATSKNVKNSYTLSFPVELAGVGGSFILATPTNGAGSNETSGIWFVNEPGDNHTPSLNLVSLPEGWVYQAWAVYDGSSINIGRFIKATGKDNFSNYSGPRSFPEFPGEDFLTNVPAGSNLSFPIDLSDGKGSVLVTVEPALSGLQNDPTGDDDIYSLVVLRTDIVKGAEPLVSIDLDNVVTEPNGTVQILTK